MAWVGWVRPDDLGTAPFAEVWSEGADLSPDLAEVLLTSAREACEAYAPAAPDGDDDVTVARSWRVAQVMQARAVYRSFKAGGGDAIGGDGLAVTVFPLDWSVRQLLRPRTGRPVIA